VTTKKASKSGGGQMEIEDGRPSRKTLGARRVEGENRPVTGRKMDRKVVAVDVQETAGAKGLRDQAVRLISAQAGGADWRSK
jgi:hypothetical protein